MLAWRHGRAELRRLPRVAEADRRTGGAPAGTGGAAGPERVQLVDAAVGESAAGAAAGSQATDRPQTRRAAGSRGSFASAVACGPSHPADAALPAGSLCGLSG